MRYPAAIFAAFILMLAFLPCSDAHHCSEDTVEDRPLTHDHSDDAEDHCTVLCVCSCCGVLTTHTAAPPVITESRTLPSALRVRYVALQTKTVPDAVWHPPSRA